VDNHGPADRNAVKLAAESFPGTVADGIKAAAAGALRQPARSAVPSVAVRKATRPGWP
jgi:hypothetical protein